MRLKSLVLPLALVLLIVSPTPAETKTGSPERELLPERVVTATLGGDPEDPDDDVYRVTFTDDMVQASFLVSSSGWDMDLYLSRDERLGDYADAEFAMDSTDHAEELVLNRFWGDGNLETGTWYLHVVGNPPQDIREKSEPKYTLVFRPARQLPVSIRPGIHSGKVEWAKGMTASYAFDVPQGTPAFRVAVQGNHMDMDLFLRKDSPLLNRGDADVLGDSYLARESVIVREADVGSSISGRWHLVVTQSPAYEHPDIFQLSLSLGTDVPVAFKTLPPSLAPASGSPLERAAYAVVEVLHEHGGGSGVMVSSEGLLLTNHHVITGPDHEPVREAAIAFTLDFGKPAVELFWADVMWSDQDKDLAVLQIRRGLYDQEIPRGYRFPFLVPAPASAPGLGASLWIIGFPSLGGSGSKTSVTLTRGVVAGFEETFFGRVLKSDAEINHGNSGGAALDENLRFFALPTSTISDEGGQLGFMHPVSFIPAEWLQRMGR